MNAFAKSLLLLLASLPAFAQDAAPTAPAPMPPADASPDRGRTVVANLARYSEHGRMSAAIRASGMAGALEAQSPLTVFAPTDSAFSSMVNVSLDELLKPENRGKLAELLRYHVVVGLLDTSTLDAKIQAGGGQAQLTTIQGGILIVKRDATGFTVTDATNHTARISRTDLYQRNGVVQVVDQVLMPSNP